MQALRVLLCCKNVSVVKESGLHCRPIPSFSNIKRFSSVHLPLISYINQRSFCSNGQSLKGEEVDEAARLWTLEYPISEQAIASPTGEVVVKDDHSGELNTLQKGKLVKIMNSEDESEVGKNTSVLRQGQNKWPSGASEMSNLGKKKEKKLFFCQSCCASFTQWLGTCRSCGVTASLKQNVKGKLVPRRLADVLKGMNQSDKQIPLNGLLGKEVAGVLGGGLVPGALVLLGGDPGIGKSTLVLQIAAMICQPCSSGDPARVLYVSGEESIEQIGNRADRLGILAEDLYLHSSTAMEDILDTAVSYSPKALIVDSIQTVHLSGISASAGGILQVRECAMKLLQFAKQNKIPVILIGHVTKTGNISGPHLLEHLVDVVLYMEGERNSSYRVLRAVKNRFGTTDELGLLELTESGLQAVSNPSQMFLREIYSNSDILAGIAFAILVDESRSLVIEIQALCISGQSELTRYITGIQKSRADMIISVLMKQAGIKLQNNLIFLNVIGGLKLTETAGDLGIAAAICSSCMEISIPSDVAFIGEVGLGGELRTVPRMDKRAIAAAKLGFRRCVVPMEAVSSLSCLQLSIQILGCQTLKDVIATIFPPPSL